MHDPLSVGELVDDELRQRRESGYDVSALEARVADMQIMATLPLLRPAG